MSTKSIYPSGSNERVFTMNMETYSRQPTTYDCLLLNHLNQEISTAQDYQGRELLELLQNADDAGAHSVKIELSETSLKISNDGDHPFTIEGYASIMRSDQSPKHDPRYIGCKGLGFRSILNWASSISLKSKITPSSDKQIECRFSQEIADARYKELRKKWGRLPDNVENLLNEAMNATGRRSPIAILAIPEVCEQRAGEWTTEIEVNVNQEVIERVKDSLMKMVHSYFYLFLHNLSCLTVIIDGKATFIECSKQSNCDCSIKVTSNGETINQEWIISRYEDLSQRISVAAARCTDQDFNHRLVPLHSFFPTKIYPEYGCILHASINLDKSRNHMLKTPEEIFQRLAKVVCDLAERTKELRRETPTWEAYDILRGTSNLLGEWEIFEKELAKYRLSESLCPTAAGSFISLKDGDALSEDFSNWVEEIGSTPEELTSIFKGGFSSYGIEAHLTDTLIKKLDSFCQRNLSLLTRVGFIKTIASGINGLKTKSFRYPINLPIFTDNGGSVITGTAYFLTGRKNELPSILDICVINYKLHEDLKDILRHEYEDFARIYGRNVNEGPERKLAAYLALISSVSTTDFTDIKDKLTRASRESHDVKQDTEMIRYLYEEYMADQDSFVMDTAVPLHLNNKIGKLRQINDLIYETSEDNWMSECPDWATVCGCSESEARKFMVDKLRMASRVPLKFERLSINGYLNAINIDNVDDHSAQVQEITSSSQYRFGKGYVIDEEWMNQNPKLQVIKSILDDDFAYNTVIRNPYPIFYKKRVYIYPIDAPYSPAAYSLRKQWGELNNYVASTDTWIGEPLFSTEGFDNDRLRRLTISLGAVRDETELDVSALYRAVATVPRQGHAEKYQRLKEILHKRNFNCPPQGLTLWATTAGLLLEEKQPAEKLYYSDNVLPRALSNKIMLFDIGHREGEDRVRDIFGVRKCSDIKTVPIVEGNLKLPHMTDSILKLIKDRLRIILAFRCRRIRDQKTRHQQLKVLEKLNIQVYSSLRFSYQTINDPHAIVETLNKWEYIMVSDNNYALVGEETNISANIRLMESIASILCHAFKVDGVDQHRGIYNLLRADIDEISHIIQQDYTADYIQGIENLISGGTSIDTTPEKRLDYPFSVVRTICNIMICKLHEDFSKFPETQLEYFDKKRELEDSIEQKARKWYDENLRNFNDYESLKSALLDHFEITHKQNEVISVPGICEEYMEWLKRKQLEIPYDAQHELGRYYSLLFFPGNLENLKRYYNTIQNATEPDKLSSGTANKELIEGSGRIVKPKPLKSGGNRQPGAFRHKSTRRHQSATGKDAEFRVKEYLEKKGYIVFSSSSNTDASRDDLDHYDLLYNKEGVDRFVEVKSTTDGTIYLSADQFIFARDHQNNYDLYVVHDDKVTPFESAFRMIDENKTAEGYLLKFESLK